MVAFLVFAAVVLATSMPVEALLVQHHQLDAAAVALSRAEDADRSLSAQLRELSNPEAVNDLARADYGLVAAGQKAYVILPAAGASSSAVAGSGHVPLDDSPVVPGSALSRQLLGLAPLTAGTDAKAATSSGAAAGHKTVKARPAGGGVGFWPRVVQTLEFWR